MKSDAAWFQRICIRLYGESESGKKYLEYLEGISSHLKQAKLNPSADDPRTISKVFAARHLTKSGPASYGYASFDFQDLMFVDVEVLLRSGKKHLKRTLVIKDRDGKWYAHPMPDISPLLRDGLYEESDSESLVGESVRQ